MNNQNIQKAVENNILFLGSTISSFGIIVEAMDDNNALNKDVLDKIQYLLNTQKEYISFATTIIDRYKADGGKISYEVQEFIDTFDEIVDTSQSSIKKKYEKLGEEAPSHEDLNISFLKEVTKEYINELEDFLKIVPQLFAECVKQFSKTGSKFIDFIVKQSIIERAGDKVIGILNKLTIPEEKEHLFEEEYDYFQNFINKVEDVLNTIISKKTGDKVEDKTETSSQPTTTSQSTLEFGYKDIKENLTITVSVSTENSDNNVSITISNKGEETKYNKEDGLNAIKKLKDDGVLSQMDYKNLTKYI